MRIPTRRAEAPASVRPDHRPGGLRFFVVSWLLLAVAMASWSVTTPLFASPDEPAQVVKAAAVVRGELTGRTIEQPGTYFEIITGVQVPAYYADALDNTACFITEVSEPADCAPPFEADDVRDTEVQTWIGRYPPLYYGIVGLPSLVSDGEAAVLGMRIAGAVLCAGFLALGLWALRASRHGAAMLAAGWLALTPTVFFFGGVVNSSGLEIAAGFATWCLLVPLVRDPGRYDVRGRLAAGTATAAVLLNTRPGSGLLALLIAVCLVVLATREFWRRALSGRTWLPALVIAAIGAVTAGLWLLVVDPTASLGGIPDARLASPSAAIDGAVDLTGRYVKEQLAVFGTLNVTLHPVLLWALGLTVGAAVLGGLILGRGSLRWGLALLLLFAFALPVLSQVPSAADLGLIWQGRYGLPLSIGLPVVAMAAITSRPVGATIARWGALAVTLFVAVVHAGAFGWSLWRYGYGFGSPLFSVPLEWTPPAGWSAPVAFLVADLGLMLMVALAPGSVLRRRPARESLDPTTGGPEQDVAGREPEPAGRGDGATST
jgi:hypothetical protein